MITERTVYKEMNFDAVSDSYKVPFGYINGSDDVLIIKAGKGGDYRGYDNKYLRIATLINKKYGYTVICISNPIDVNNVAYDVEIISCVTRQLGIENPQFYFMGASDGAFKGLMLLSSGTKIERMLLINMPLMVNFYKTVACLSSSPNTSIRLVIGESDPSFPYVPFLRLKNITNLDIQTISGADHNFSGMLDEMIEMCVSFFAI